MSKLVCQTQWPANPLCHQQNKLIHIKVTTCYLPVVLKLSVLHSFDLF